VKRLIGVIGSDLRDFSGQVQAVSEGYGEELPVVLEFRKTLDVFD
jgi:hypothetical protein